MVLENDDSRIKSLSIICDRVPDNNDLTVTTVISFSPDVIDKEPPSVVLVESLVGKSLESIKSVALSDSDQSDDKLEKEEQWYATFLQVFIPFMIAGCGTIGAGIVLGTVEEYEVFKNVKALFVLVPALLGLKGNLDMCLASRLSTQAHLGNFHERKELIKMIVGNVALVQVQAIVASTLVAIFAVCVSAILNGDFQWVHAVLLSSAGVLTATLTCFILDFVLIAVIITSFKLKLNPDNLATPFAASIGDVVSLLVLSTWASLLYKIHDDYPYVLVIILAVYLVLILPIWVIIVYKNRYTRKVLTSGWTPVLSGLVISGLGGIVLDSAVDQFSGFVLFQPIINGIGGNLVSVQASRISTMLHKTSIKGVIPPHTKHWVLPWTALLKGVPSAQSARILLLMVIPGQAVFMFAADSIYNGGESNIELPFALTYLTTCLVQIMILLYICHLMIHTLWRFKRDPDNFAIPYLTAMGDLLGSTLLLLGFMFLRSIHAEYTPSKFLAN